MATMIASSSMIKNCRKFFSNIKKDLSDNMDWIAFSIQYSMIGPDFLTLDRDMSPKSKTGLQYIIFLTYIPA